MHERAPILKATPRERLGTRYAKRDRAKGKLPGVIYGHGSAPLAVNFDGVDAVKHIEAGEKVFRVDLPNQGSDQMLLLKELQFDYLGDTIVHADFARVDLDERVRTRVHIELTGEAKGLKTAGAILMHPTSEIEIECRVRDIPEQISVEIAELDVDQSVTAGSIKLPLADMKLITDSLAVLAQIVVQKEEIVAAEATAVGTDAAQPEVIGEKERLEKAAAEAAGKPGAKPAAGAAPAKPAAGAAPKK
ncbi:MAG: 50S ribosomal protein L25 [Phycisphaerales bacterium]